MMLTARMKMVAAICAAVLAADVNDGSRVNGVFAAETHETLTGPTEGPRIVSWRNSHTRDRKTVFQVKPGRKITFTVKADGAEEYLWLVDGTIQKSAKADSFTWTVPNKKGMWKILLKTTNPTRRQWIKKQTVLWNKWIKVRKDRAGRSYPQRKTRFIQGMTDHRLYPLKTRKEWIVSTFLARVKPGESIQKAIDSVPPEGGIVELAPGIHEVNETTYPTRTFHCFAKDHPPIKYSIIIKRSNVTVCGTRDAVVRHDIGDAGLVKHRGGLRKGVQCFLLPDMEADGPNVYVENITFRGFTTASAYTKKDRVISRLIFGRHVRNLTVEDIHDKSYAAGLVDVGNPQVHHRYSENIFYKNNTVEHGKLAACFCRNLYILNNTLHGDPGWCPLHVDRNTYFIYIAGNNILKAGGSVFALIIDSGHHYDVYNNTINGSRRGLVLNHVISPAIVEKNTITGTSQWAIEFWHRAGFDNVIVTNNLIYNNRGTGIQHHEMRGIRENCEALIANNTICNNGADGIKMVTKWDNSTIHGNIITGNKGYGINHTSGKVSIGHNDVWNNAKGDYEGCSAGADDFSKNPLFANPSDGDFHLKSKAGRWNPKAKKWVKDNVHSPCIDAGDSKADFSREPSPNGERVNVGAYGNTAEASKSIEK